MVGTRGRGPSHLFAKDVAPAHRGATVNRPDYENWGGFHNDSALLPRRSPLNTRSHHPSPHWGKNTELRRTLSLFSAPGHRENDYNVPSSAHTAGPVLVADYRNRRGLSQPHPILSADAVHNAPAQQYITGRRLVVP